MRLAIGLAHANGRRKQGHIMKIKHLVSASLRTTALACLLTASAVSSISPVRAEQRYLGPICVWGCMPWDKPEQPKATLTTTTPAAPVATPAPPAPPAILSGQVTIDPAYAANSFVQNLGLSKGVQSALIGQDGAGVIAAGAGNLQGALIVDRLLANGLITSDQAAKIIASGGGNVIAQGGGNVIAQGGGNVLGNNGTNVIAQGGGNVIAQGGGNVIAVLQKAGLSAAQIANVSAVISNDGGSLIIAANSAIAQAARSAGLVSNAGGTLIGSDGAGKPASGILNDAGIGNTGGKIVSNDGATLVALAKAGSLIASGGGNARSLMDVDDPKAAIDTMIKKDVLAAKLTKDMDTLQKNPNDKKLQDAVLNEQVQLAKIVDPSGTGLVKNTQTQVDGWQKSMADAKSAADSQRDIVKRDEDYLKTHPEDKQFQDKYKADLAALQTKDQAVKDAGQKVNDGTASLTKLVGALQKDGSLSANDAKTLVATASAQQLTAAQTISLGDGNLSKVTTAIAVAAVPPVATSGSLPDMTGKLSSIDTQIKKLANTPGKTTAENNEIATKLAVLNKQADDLRGKIGTAQLMADVQNASQIVANATDLVKRDALALQTAKNGGDQSLVLQLTAKLNTDTEAIKAAGVDLVNKSARVQPSDIPAMLAIGAKSLETVKAGLDFANATANAAPAAPPPVVLTAAQTADLNKAQAKAAEAQTAASAAEAAYKKATDGGTVIRPADFNTRVAVDIKGAAMAVANAKAQSDATQALVVAANNGDPNGVVAASLGKPGQKLTSQDLSNLRDKAVTDSKASFFQQDMAAGGYAEKYARANFADADLASAKTATDTLKNLAGKTTDPAQLATLSAAISTATVVQQAAQAKSDQLNADAAVVRLQASIRDGNQTDAQKQQSQTEVTRLQGVSKASEATLATMVRANPAVPAIAAVAANNYVAPTATNPSGSSLTTIAPIADVLKNGVVVPALSQVTQQTGAAVQLANAAVQLANAALEQAKTAPVTPAAGSTIDFSSALATVTKAHASLHSESIGRSAGAATSATPVAPPVPVVSAAEIASSVKLQTDLAAAQTQVNGRTQQISSFNQTLTDLQAQRATTTDPVKRAGIDASINSTNFQLSVLNQTLEKENKQVSDLKAQVAKTSVPAAAASTTTSSSAVVKPAIQPITPPASAKPADKGAAKPEPQVAKHTPETSKRDDRTESKRSVSQVYKPASVPVTAAPKPPAPKPPVCTMSMVNGRPVSVCH